MGAPSSCSRAKVQLQFLNSVLSSIGNKDIVPSPPLPPTPNLQLSNDTTRLDAQRNGNVSEASTNSTGNKRKAEGALPRENEKAAKGTGYRGTSSLVSPCMISQQSPGSKKPSTLSGPSSTSLLTRAAKQTPVAASPAAAPSSTASPAVSQINGVDTPAKTLKKGSYAEIMARAKASQQAPPAVGTIRHQAKDKKALSDKKELLLQKRAKFNKGKSQPPNGHSRNSSGEISGSSATRPVAKPGETERKKAPEIAYKGTAKPKPQPTYKGTMKPVGPPSATAQKKPLPRSQESRYRYASYSDEEEDVEEEGGYSDESDDMEAGFSDVEEEEAKATKLARKEDEEEARKEAEHQARKKRLKELAKKAKPQRY